MVMGEPIRVNWYFQVSVLTRLENGISIHYGGEWTIGSISPPVEVAVT